MSRPLTRRVQTEEVQRLELAAADFVPVFGGHASEVPGDDAEDWLAAGYASPRRPLPQPRIFGFQPVVVSGWSDSASPMGEKRMALA